MISGPVGTSSDIASKGGFFASIFEGYGQLKRFLRCNAGRIWIRIYLNPKVEFLISNLVPYCMVTSIFYLPSSVLNEIAIIKS